MANNSDVSGSEGTSRNLSPMKVHQRPIRSKKMPAKVRQLQDEHKGVDNFLMSGV